MRGYIEKIYLGLSKTTFKVCFGNHEKSLTKLCHKSDMELSRNYRGNATLTTKRNANVSYAQIRSTKLLVKSETIYQAK